MINSRLTEELKLLGIEATHEQQVKVSKFEEALYASNEVKNLTRIPREEAWIKHILDSVLFHDLIPLGSSVLDIGAGPGFPAWPLALLRPDLQVTAVDSNGKMLDFLRSQPLQNLSVVETRIEEWDQFGVFDVVTGRAVAPLSIQLEISVPFARVSGLILPMRTPNDIEEIQRCGDVLGAILGDIVERTLPVLEAPRVVPVYTKIKRSQHGYPRRWADIKRQPL